MLNINIRNEANLNKLPMQFPNTNLNLILKLSFKLSFDLENLKIKTKKCNNKIWYFCQISPELWIVFKCFNFKVKIIYSNYILLKFVHNT